MDEREEISLGLSQGLSCRQIARLLSHHDLALDVDHAIFEDANINPLTAVYPSPISRPEDAEFRAHRTTQKRQRFPDSLRKRMCSQAYAKTTGGGPERVRRGAKKVM